MPGAVHLLILLILVTPMAAAGPSASVSVGPGGDGGPDEPYYLRADIGAPEAPGPAEEGADCARDERPADTVTGVERVTKPLLAWDPREEPRLSGWFPECIALVAPASPVPGGYASYDVTTGRYYAEVPAATISIVPAPRSTTSVSGSTGVGILADCEYCPPPDLG